MAAFVLFVIANPADGVIVVVPLDPAVLEMIETPAVDPPVSDTAPAVALL
jgi:hypothetical protein